MGQLSRYHVSAPNSFALLRYLFAFCIFCNHACIASGNDIFLCESSVFVWGFFLISGLLTFNSYIKTPDLKSFVARRIRRILPAYLAVVLMGFIAGMFLTSLPFSEFLHNAQTWKYLGANAVFLNYLQPTLPGVFEGNVLPFVNASLWTMKVEIMFYVSVPIVYWLINRYGRNKVIISIILLSILYDVLTAELYNYTGNPVYAKLNHQVFGMFAYFYAPVLLLFNKEKIRKHIVSLLVLSIPLLLCAYSNEWVKRLSPFTLSIVLVAFAYGVKKLHFSYGWKDVSYEFYLLHFPVLQVFLAINPSISLPVLLVMSLTFTLVLAMALNKVLAIWISWKSVVF